MVIFLNLYRTGYFVAKMYVYDIIKTSKMDTLFNNRSATFMKITCRWALKREMSHTQC